MPKSFHPLGLANFNCSSSAVSGLSSSTVPMKSYVSPAKNLCLPSASFNCQILRATYCNRISWFSLWSCALSFTIQCALEDSCGAWLKCIVQVLRYCEIRSLAADVVGFKIGRKSRPIYLRISSFSLSFLKFAAEYIKLSRLYSPIVVLFYWRWFSRLGHTFCFGLVDSLIQLSLLQTRDQIQVLNVTWY